MSRYIVTEISGYLNPMSNGKQEGISVQVIDTKICHRVVKSWRSEDYRGASGVSAPEQVRIRAERHAAALNEGRPVPRVTMYRKERELHVIERVPC